MLLLTATVALTALPIPTWADTRAKWFQKPSGSVTINISETSSGHTVPRCSVSAQWTRDSLDMRFSGGPNCPAHLFCKGNRFWYSDTAHHVSYTVAKARTTTIDPLGNEYASSYNLPFTFRTVLTTIYDPMSPENGLAPDSTYRSQQETSWVYSWPNSGSPIGITTSVFVDKLTGLPTQQIVTNTTSKNSVSFTYTWGVKLKAAKPWTFGKTKTKGLASFGEAWTQSGVDRLVEHLSNRLVK